MLISTTKTRIQEELKQLNSRIKMNIQSVISYKGSWDSARQSHQCELDEIVSAFSDCTTNNVILESSERLNPRIVWEKALYDRGWQLLDRTHYSIDGRRIPIGQIGPVKNGIGAQIAFGFNDSLSRWIFQQSALAIRHSLITLPVLCVLMNESSRRIPNDRAVFSRTTFEQYKNQLELLSPLSHSFPFLILGISDQASLVGPNVIEIKSDVQARNEATTINRCIKFTPEYQQAGLGILNYFSTYLREQYPNEDATISIEQHGLNVRLTIETPNGKSEVIERALHEYELIVSGKEAPEKFTDNDKVILEMRNEIRIFKARVEFSQDVLGIKDKQIDQLMNLVSQGLLKPSPIVIDFKPTINNSNSLIINQNIASALGGISELVELLPQTSPENLMLTEVAGSLEAIEMESDPATVRKSPAMSKFRRVLEKFLDASDSANAAINKIENGLDVVKDLGKKYNSIAEWCGLPVIPSVFTK
jgi:HSP20 family molecular chaperone IbpA